MREGIISMRRESPSPTSQAAHSSISVNGSTNSIPPKPPTPTGSPKLPRPKTAPLMADGSNLGVDSKQNILRQNVDMDSDEDELAPLAGSPDSPTNPSLVRSPDLESSSSSPSPKGLNNYTKYGNGSDSCYSLYGISNQSVGRTQSYKESSIQRIALPTGFFGSKNSYSASSKPVTKGASFEGNSYQNGPNFNTIPNTVNPKSDYQRSNSSSNEPISYTLNSPSLPLKSHPVSRSGVVVPDTSPLHRPLMRKTNDEIANENCNTVYKESFESTPIRRESPKHAAPEKRNSLTQLSGLQDKPVPTEGFTRVASARFNQNSRPNRLRNVQVLPDKNLLKDKSGGSNEYLHDSGTSTNSVQKKRSEGSISMENSDLIISHTPRPPLKKRVLNNTTDSDENSETEAGCNSNLPPKGQRSSASSMTKHRSPNKKKLSTPTPSNIAANAKKSDHFQTTDAPSSVCRPEYREEQIECYCDDVMDVQSDSGTSPTKYNNKKLVLPEVIGSSQDLPSDNRTVPQIRYPSARLAKQSEQSTSQTSQTKTSQNKSSALQNQIKSGSHNCLCSSPPKQVTWDLKPAVMKYEDVFEDVRGSQSATEDADNDTGRTKITHKTRRSEKSSHCRQPRRHSIDERMQEVRLKEQNPNIQLLLLHESFLEQSSQLIKYQMNMVSDVKQGKRRFRDYKDLTIESLSNHLVSIQKMMDFLKLTHDTNQVSTPL